MAEFLPASTRIGSNNSSRVYDDDGVATSEIDENIGAELKPGAHPFSLVEHHERRRSTLCGDHVFSRRALLTVHDVELHFLSFRQ